jgi:hypothetical protein
VVRHRRSFLQRAAVLEVRSDPGRPEAVVAELGGDAGCPRRAGGSSHNRCLRQHRAGRRTGAATDRAEQRPLGVIAQARAVEIGDQVSVEVVMARHRVPLAALLAQPHPRAPVLRVDTQRGAGLDHARPPGTLELWPLMRLSHSQRAAVNPRRPITAAWSR